MWLSLLESNQIDFDFSSYRMVWFKFQSFYGAHWKYIVRKCACWRIWRFRSVTRKFLVLKRKKNGFRSIGNAGYTCVLYVDNVCCGFTIHKHLWKQYFDFVWNDNIAYESYDETVALNAWKPRISSFAKSANDIFTLNADKTYVSLWSRNREMLWNHFYVFIARFTNWM